MEKCVLIMLNKTRIIAWTFYVLALIVAFIGTFLICSFRKEGSLFLLLTFIFVMISAILMAKLNRARLLNDSKPTDKMDKKELTLIIIIVVGVVLIGFICMIRYGERSLRAGAITIPDRVNTGN